MRFENLMWYYTFSWIAAYRAMAEQAIAGCDIIEATLRPMPVLTPIPAPRQASRTIAASATVVPFPAHRVRRPQRYLA